jgi:pyridoxal biosynthesis lyase PdxS
MAPSTASSSFNVKAGLAQMLKGGVIMDMTDASQARIAEEAGACAVTALERVPADIRKDGECCSHVRPCHDQRDPSRSHNSRYG